MSGNDEQQRPAGGPAPPAGWQAFLDQSRDLLCASDGEGVVGWCNLRYTEATGLAPGSRVLDLPGDRAEGERARASLAAMLAGRPGETTLLFCRGRNEAALWLEPRLTVTADGNRLWSFRDVTAERFLAAQASHQGELLDLAQDFGRLGIWERDVRTGEGRWDRHTFRMWGLDPARGTPSLPEAMAHIHPDDRAQFHFPSTMTSPGRYSQHYRVLHPDGSVRRVHSQWEVTTDHHGAPERAIGVMMDDTAVYDEASALGNVNAQLRLAVELGQIYIWRHDLQAQTLHYNASGYAFFGFEPGPDGIPVSEVRTRIHPDDLPVVEQSMTTALVGDQPVDMEVRYCRHDGQWRTAMTRRVAERDAEGRIVAFIGVALDITERVEQRRRAEDLAHRLEAASGAAGIGIWTATTDRADTDWNEQMYVLFDRFDRADRTRTPSLAEWVETCVHPDDRTRVRAEARRCFGGGDGPFELQCRTLRRSGEVRWIVIRATVEHGAGKRRLLGVCIDFTERHAALEALREVGERARLITRYAGIGTWEANLDNSGETWDEQMFLLRGLAPRPQALSRDERLALVHPDDAHRVVDSEHRLTLEAALPASYEFRVRLPDGRWRWLASRSAAVVDATGKPVRRVGVNWDITEAREAESARQQAAIAEREVLAKTQFLSRMSHELRTPLNAVLGFTQLLQVEAQRAGLPAQLAKLGHIKGAGDHLLSLINDVLDLSGLESGELRLQLRRVDLGALIGEALPLVEPLAAQHGVVIQVLGRAGQVHADPTRLRQVLINLLSNAIKYNVREGRVMVDTGNDAAGVLIRVRDTGRGLTGSQLARLFEPFNRFGAEREGIEGTGIGLVIVKALVEGMGGRILADSVPGRGTVFEVRLPVPPADAPLVEAPLADPLPVHAPRRHDPPGPATAASPLPGARGRILYIEDNPVNVLLVEELVRTVGGFEIASEATGATGVQRTRSDRPDLVLVDLQLPDIDGFEVLRRLRADPATRDIPCIALSANALPDDIRRGLAAGFAEYWTKPVDFAAFTASLRRLFPQATA